MIVRWIRTALTTATTLTMLTIAALYGIAYGVIGYYAGAAIEATGVGTGALYAWLFVWVGIGTIALTVWTIRFTGIDVRRQGRRPASQVTQ